MVLLLLCGMWILGSSVRLSRWLLNDLLFNFMQMSVLLVCSYVHHNVQCPQRSEGCQISCGCWGRNLGALKEFLTKLSHLPVLPVL